MNDTPMRQDSSKAPDSSGSGRRPQPPPDDARVSGETRIVEPGTLDMPLSEASSGGQPQAPSPETSAFNPWDPAPGMLLGGYRLDEKLGEGGMGAVWKARHLKLDKDVAIKLLSTRQAPSRAAADRFEREMKAVGKLEHPHLVRAYDAGEAAGVKYLVMEFIDGVDLAHHVKTKGPLPLDKALRIIERAARGLAAAHEAGLVHRDIKPANLMVDKRGQLKITDLGLARLAGDETDEGNPLTGTGAVLGTPDYMSPEQWEETHTVDARCDLYALGCTLFFLLTGEAPYGDRRTTMQKMQAHVMVPPPEISVTLAERGISLAGLPESGAGESNTRTLSTSLASPVPESVAAMYRKLVAKKPEDRYGSAQELVDALGPILAELAAPKAPRGETTPTSPTVMESRLDSSFAEFSRIASEAKRAGSSPSPTPVPPQRPAATHKWLWGAAAAAAVLFGVVVIIKKPDGTTQKIKLKPGEKVEIATEEDDPPTKPAGTKPAATKPEPSTKPNPGTKPAPANVPTTEIVDANDTADDQEVHRRAARAVVAVGGGAGILLPSGQFMWVNSADAPALSEPFVLCIVACSGLQSWDDRGMQTLWSIPTLKELAISGTSVTDAGWEGWPAESCLETVSLDQTRADRNVAEVVGRISTLSRVDWARYVPLGPDELTGFARLPRLRMLNGCTPSSGLGSLAESVSLRVLSVNPKDETPLDGVALSKLPHLMRLFVTGGTVDAATLEALAESRSLRHVEFHTSNRPPDALAAFRQRRPDVFIGEPALPADETVRVGVRWALAHGSSIWAARADGEGGDQVPQGKFVPTNMNLGTDQIPVSTGFEHLQAFRPLGNINLGNLKNADLCAAELARLGTIEETYFDVGTLTGQGFRSLFSLTALSGLALPGVPASFNSESWDGIAQCEGLQSLNCGGVPVRDDDLAKIARCRQLGTLRFYSGPSITAAGLRHLQPLRWLTELRMEHVPVGDSDEVVAALSELKGLRFLFIQHTGLSAARVAKLHAALPHCAIFHDGGMVVPKRLGGAGKSGAK
jgi:serine/threonine protein kinase